ncbi:hypothetical protein Tco_0963754, partial [Tanacetum coccineum]
MVDDADATKVPNTESSKATSKAPCAVKNKRKRRQPTDGVEEEILGVLKVIAEKIVESEPPRKLKPPTLEDCQGKLIDLKWVEDDPLYEVALAIFCEPNDRYREGWMKLKPERTDVSRNDALMFAKDYAIVLYIFLLRVLLLKSVKLLLLPSDTLKPHLAVYHIQINKKSGLLIQSVVPKEVVESKRTS